MAKKVSKQDTTIAVFGLYLSVLVPILFYWPLSTYEFKQKRLTEFEEHRVGRTQHHICHFEKEKRCYLHC